MRGLVARGSTCGILCSAPRLVGGASQHCVGGLMAVVRLWRLSRMAQPSAGTCPQPLGRECKDGAAVNLDHLHAKSAKVRICRGQKMKCKSGVRTPALPDELDSQAMTWINPSNDGSLVKTQLSITHFLPDYGWLSRRAWKRHDCTQSLRSSFHNP